MIVLKFGGSSVAKPERILQIVDILVNYYEQGNAFTVVFSAFGGVTDSLIEMSRLAAAGDNSYGDVFNAFSKRHSDAANALLNGDILAEVQREQVKNHKDLKDLLHGVYLLREATKRTMDYILSFGERNSSYLISKVLQQKGINAHYLDARKVIKTDNSFSVAKVNMQKTAEAVSAYYTNNPGVKIVTGFVASDDEGNTTTLGRGGSDYTASLLANSLDAKQIEIWTDVSGVLTSDPRKVKKAFTIPALSYAEAMEMSHFGAKVIYPPTLAPALNKKIPIYIKNTFEPNFDGTFISATSGNGRAVKGISSISNVSLLTLSGSGLFGVPGIAARLFQSLANAGINIILITQGSSESSISFAVSPADAASAKAAVDYTFEYEISKRNINAVAVENDLSVIAIIGENMRYQPGVAGRLFQSLGKNGINTVAIAQGSSELNVSVVINRYDETKALNVLHQAFFLSDTRTLHLFMVGVGLIGKTLIKQIAEQTVYLKTQNAVEVNIVGMANSKRMIFNEDGLDLSSWQDQLATAKSEMTMQGFVAQMKDMNMSNAIFIDNTASENITQYYEQILDASISISTPNKIATSSSYIQYNRLKTLAQKRGVYFMYETNVGAGLPLISTLSDLINSGDQILKLEAVLSGSLSYIFNNFRGDNSFHKIVREAKALGYTEPDPREDLNGLDVRRKIIILAREIGLSLEQADVEIQNVLPSKCQEVETVDELFEVLKAEDAYFENLKAEAEAEGKVLRMVAKLDKGKASIALESVDDTHAFYSLNGSDNMVVLTTKRYHERPLVIRGPGAGAEVTAAGVFAEVLTIGNLISK
jgi:aspartokinase/homoserine dehydrogenase 1